MNETTDDDGSIDPTALDKLNRSLVMVKIGNREYSMVKSTRCGVCMHPARFAIEEKLLQNYGYPAIVRWISEQEVRKDNGTIEKYPELTRIQIKHHRDNGHLGLNMSMVKEIAERRAKDAGIDIENHMGQYVDHVIARQYILNRGYERLIKGEIEPEVKDVLAASKLMQELEQANRQNASVEQYQSLIMRFWRTTQEIVGPEKFRQIIARLEDDPVVRQFQQQRTIEGETS